MMPFIPAALRPRLRATSIRAMRDAAALGPSPCCFFFSSSSAVRVLTPVVVGELAGLDRAPPVLAIAIPRDRLRQALREGNRGQPAERPRLAGVEGIAPVVAGAVGDVPDAGLQRS